MSLPSSFPLFLPDDRSSRIVAPFEASGSPARTKYDLARRTAAFSASARLSVWEPIVGPFPSVPAFTASGALGDWHALVDGAVPPFEAAATFGVWEVVPVFLAPLTFSVVRSSDYLSTTLGFTFEGSPVQIKVYRSSGPREPLTELATLNGSDVTYTDAHGDPASDFVYLVAAISWTIDEGPLTPASYTFGAPTARA